MGRVDVEIHLTGQLSLRRDYPWDLLIRKVKGRKNKREAEPKHTKIKIVSLRYLHQEKG